MDKIQQLIPRNKAIEYVSKHGKYPVGKIIDYLQTVKIEKSEVDIKDALLEMAKEENVNMDQLPTGNLSDMSSDKENGLYNFIMKQQFTFKPIDYSLKKQRFDIYKQRCSTLVKVLMMMSGHAQADNELLEKLDITIRGDVLLVSDLDRLTLPLTKNYELLQKAKKNLEEPKTYLKKISPAVYSDYLPPRTILEPFHIAEGLDTVTGEYVPMTEKQKQIAREKQNKMMKEIFDRMND